MNAEIHTQRSGYVWLFIFLIGVGIIYIVLFAYIYSKSINFIDAPKDRAAMLWAQSSTVAIPATLSFGNNSTLTKALGSGWNNPEAWGVWSNSSRATIILPALQGTSTSSVCFHFWVSALTSNPNEKWPLQIFVNSRPLTRRIFYVGPNEYEISAAAHVSKEKLTRIDFVGPNARTPRSLNGSNDPRLLSFALHSMQINHTCDSHVNSTPPRVIAQ